MDARQRLAGAVGLALAAVAASGAGAAGAAVRIPSCNGGDATNCVDTSLGPTPANARSAFLGAPRIDGGRATFASAFDAWNARTGGGWSLVDGGALDLSIAPTMGVAADDGSAGLSPVILTLGGAAPALLRRLVWTQALAIDYTPLDGRLARPIETLDTFDLSQDAAGDNPVFPKTCAAPSAAAGAADGAVCGPIYPFQYGDTLANETIDGVTLGVDPFYDAPRGLWPEARFEAITLLSEISAPHTLTVHQGVAYGFSLNASGRARGARWSGATADPVPEASTWTLALGGFAALGLAARAARRRTRRLSGAP